MKSSMNKLAAFIIFLSLIFTLSSIAKAQDEILPRTVISLYQISKDIPTLAYTPAHRFAEMPLNYLGLSVEYYDIEKGLPSLKGRKDIAGVLIWFDAGTNIKGLAAYLKWLKEAVDSKYKVVLIGNAGIFDNDSYDLPRESYLTEYILGKLGLYDNKEQITKTYNYNILSLNPELTSFERVYPEIKPPFEKLLVANESTYVFLEAVNRNDGEDDSIVIGSINNNGAYIDDEYAINNIGGNDDYPESLQWYINPFKFFSKAFNVENLPSPDVTTIAGRRILFSHIDGDGWYSYTQIEKYANKFVPCSEVIYNEIFKKYEDIPVSVGPIMAELDKNWNGTDEGRKIAKEIFALPNIEVASHTYTHPFYWEFFKNYDRKEELKSMSKNFLHYRIKEEPKSDALAEKGYTQYRAFDKYPFDLKQEIYGAFDVLTTLIPKDKKLKIVLWPGDTTPYEEVIKMSRDAGLRNINGGDTRFDRKYPSYAWVSAIGVQVGKERQIYNASANEDLYTDLWTRNFFAYRYFVQTIYNTNTPIRVKPIDIYYHMYIGERETSIDSLKHCLNYADEQDITPITTSDYCSIADGFYTTKIIKTNPNTWKILNRDGLQTIRFDNALFKTVDFEKSIGVIGQRHTHGSLYVYLDSSVKEPAISIKETDEFWTEPESKKAYLIQSRWLAWGLNFSKNSFSFSLKGFGPVEMQWKVPNDGKYSIKVGDSISFEAVAINHTLNVKLAPNNPITRTLNFSVEYAEQ